MLWGRNWKLFRILRRFRYWHWSPTSGYESMNQNNLMSVNIWFELLGEILAKPVPKKGKTLPQETLNLFWSFYEDDEYSRQMPGKKDYVSISWNVHKQKQLFPCNLSELYSTFRDKYPNIKIRFSNFCTLRPKWCVLAGSSDTHSVCICSTHQNAVLLVDAIDWEYTYKDLLKKIVCEPDNKCVWCIAVSHIQEVLLWWWGQSSG